MSRTLDALRDHKAAPPGPDLKSRRRGPDDAVLTSLGYSAGAAGPPKRGGRVLRTVLGFLILAVVASILWQIGASNRLLPSPPWHAMLGFAPQKATPKTALPATGRQPPADVAKTQKAVQAPPGEAPAPTPTAGLNVAVKPPKPVPATTSATTPARPDLGSILGPKNAGPAASPKAPMTPPAKVAKPAPIPPANRVQGAAGIAERPAALLPSLSVPLSGGAPAKAASPISRPPAGEPDHFKLALYYQRTGDFENALVQYRLVLEGNELNPEAHNNLGLLYQDKGLYEEAIREFRRATFIDPRYMTAHNNLGVALLKSGQVDAAIAELKGLAATDPRNVEVLTNLALAQKSNGGAEEARETLQRALSIDNRYAAAHYNLALILEENGEISRAIEHYEKFLASSGAEHASLTGEVRARIQVLKAKTRQ